MAEPDNARRFLAPDGCRTGETVTLAPEQSRHMVTVLRISMGEKVRLFTGQGQEFLGTVQEAHPRRARVRVMRPLQPREADRSIVLGFAPAPDNRTDFLVEKAAELGATHLQPLVCERSQGGRVEQARRRSDRWERKLEEAARQSQRAVVPQLAPPAPLLPFLRVASGLRIIAAGPAHPPLQEALERVTQAPETVVLAVGPAGGFTEREVRRAGEAGFQAVSLGPHTLRVETAGVVLLGAVVMRLDYLARRRRE